MPLGEGLSLMQTESVLTWALPILSGRSAHHIQVGQLAISASSQLLPIADGVILGEMAALYEGPGELVYFSWFFSSPGMFMCTGILSGLSYLSPRFIESRSDPVLLVKRLCTFWFLFVSLVFISAQTWGFSPYFLLYSLEGLKIVNLAHTEIGMEKEIWTTWATKFRDSSN